MAGTFQTILNRLFSNKVVIKKMPSGRIKTVDFNRLQSSGNYQTGKYRGLRMTANGQSTAYTSGYSSNSQMEQLDVLRNTLYVDYELMDNDPILAGALDIYADEVTVNNAHGDVLTINCSDANIKQILYNLHYDILNIDFNLWSWVRTLCKFGDLFLYTPTMPTVGIIDAIPIHPSLMSRRDNMGAEQDETRFLFDPAYASQQSYAMTKSEFTIQEISHMRLVTNTNFLPYGKSMLEGARKVWKQLCLPEFSQVWTDRGAVSISELKVSDTIISYDIDNKNPYISKVKNWVPTGKKEVFEIKSTNRKFYGTSEHLYLTSNGEYKSVDNLTVADNIIVADIASLKNENIIPNLKLENAEIVARFEPDYFKNSVRVKKGKCLLCNDSKLKRLNSLHLKYKHGIEFEEYRKITGIDNYFNLMNRNKNVPIEVAIEFCKLYELDDSKLRLSRKNSKIELVDENLLIDNFKLFVRFFGFMLGDGWVDDSKICFSLGTRLDKSWKYVELFDKLGLKYNILKEGTSKASFTTSNLYFVDLLKQLDFINGTKNKIVPTWVFNLDSEHIKEFLLGFADADGCDLANDRFQLAGINEGLITNLHLLAQQIGLVCSNVWVTDARKNYWNPEKMGNPVHYFSFSLKQSHFNKIIDGRICQKIVSIESIGIHDVYDIEVDNNDHNFIVDGVISHNCLMEDAMLIHRIMRAPERRIFKIDVGNIAPEEIDGYMEAITNSMKKVPFMDQDGEYNLRYNMMNMLEDYYLPVRGGDTGTDISSLAGLGNDGQIDDIEYLRNKMMAFLKIPKSYMGYDDVGGKTTLPSEDIRFARTIERIQKMVTTELYKISVVHLMTQGFQPEQFADFTLTLSPPSMIYERQRVDLLNEKINLIANIKEQKMLSNKYIYENILSLSPEEWKAEEDLVIEDLKLGFRQQQIIDEGNDPAVTGKSFGTPHDIAQMHVASKLTGGNSDGIKQLTATDSRHENEGRPVKHGSFERAKDSDLGYDPTGRKQMNRTEVIQKFIKSTEKFITNKQSKRLVENTEDDEIGMLNEKLLLE